MRVTNIGCVLGFERCKLHLLNEKLVLDLLRAFAVDFKFNSKMKFVFVETGPKWLKTSLRIYSL